MDMAVGTSELAVSLTEALVKICIFASVAAARRTWFVAFSVPAFFIAAMKAILVLEPEPGSQIHNTLQSLDNKLRRHLVRLHSHTGNICLLQGEAFELDLLQKAVCDICHLAKKRCDMMFSMEMADWAFFRAPQAAAMIELAANACAAAKVAWSVAVAQLRSGTGLRVDAYEQLGFYMRDVHRFFNACTGWSSLLGAQAQLLDCMQATNRVKHFFARLERARLQHSGTAGPTSSNSSRGKDKRRDRSKEPPTGRQRVFRDEGAMITFRGVTLQNPNEEVMLRDLSFSVAEGRPLLICGHRGSGKTAIARALCALWPVGEGTISCPGGAEIAQQGGPIWGDVCYVPERPCSVLGSLADQLTYPKTLGRQGLSDVELRCWLRYVGLEHLADEDWGRATLFTGTTGRPTIDWGEVLSLREQQAFGLARLLYHRPRFAVLDECTSALGPDLERGFFQMLREVGISYITIDHRPTLQEHHAAVLELTGFPGDKGRGWHLRDVASSSSSSSSSSTYGKRSGSDGSHKDAGHADDRSRIPFRPKCRNEAEVHQRLGSCLLPLYGSMTCHSKPKRHGLELRPASASSIAIQQLVAKRWPSQASRLVAMVRLGLLTPNRRQIAIRRLLVMLLSLRIRTWLFWLFCRSLGGMARAAVTGDRWSVLLECFANCFVVAASGVADQLIRHQAGHLTLDLWVGASCYLHRRLLRHLVLRGVFYPSQSVADAVNSAVAADPHAGPLVSDPILRLLEVRSVFESWGGQLCDALVSVANLAFLLPYAVRGLGAVGPLFLALQWALLQACQGLLPHVDGDQEKVASLEAAFQAMHARVRSSAETIAACGGGALARQAIEPCFKELLAHSHAAQKRKLLHRTLITFLFDYRQLPTWAQRLLTLYFARRNCGEGMLSSSSSGSGSSSPDVVCINFLFDRLMQAPQVALQHLAKCKEKVARMDSRCKRCLELLVACEVAGKTPPLSISATSAGSDAPFAEGELEGSGSIRIRGLDLVAHSGDRLASNMTVDLKLGTPLAVTGPCGSGKSLLAGTLSGLRPLHGPGAFIAMPGVKDGQLPPLRTLMAVPQRPYLPQGCRLMAQLAYPTLLKLPMGAPYQIHVGNLPESVGDEELQDHFAPLGSVSSQVILLGAPSALRSGLVTFQNSDQVLRALARPQERLLHGQELECEFADLRQRGGCANSPPPPGDQIPHLSRMRRCLHAVSLDHVLTREADGWFARRGWEEALSHCEQQRLCLARVLYHGSAFCVLDDCTAMLPAAAEEKLHRQVLEQWGVTPIVLMRRSFMPNFFTRELQLGGEAPAWKLHE